MMADARRTIDHHLRTNTAASADDHGGIKVGSAANLHRRRDDGRRVDERVCSVQSGCNGFGSGDPPICRGKQWTKERHLAHFGVDRLRHEKPPTFAEMMIPRPILYPRDDLDPEACAGLLVLHNEGGAHREEKNAFHVIGLAAVEL
jgi:hypothetical protein